MNIHDNFDLDQCGDHYHFHKMHVLIVYSFDCMTMVLLKYSMIEWVCNVVNIISVIIA